MSKALRQMMHVSNYFLLSKTKRRRTHVKDLSLKAMTSTGIGASSAICAVFALNSLQKAMMLRPACPRAGPTGGEGFACPAGIRSRMRTATSFAAIGRSIVSTDLSETLRTSWGRGLGFIPHPSKLVHSTLGWNRSRPDVARSRRSPCGHLETEHVQGNVSYHLHRDHFVLLHRAVPLFTGLRWPLSNSD